MGKMKKCDAVTSDIETNVSKWGEVKFKPHKPDWKQSNKRSTISHNPNNPFRSKIRGDNDKNKFEKIKTRLVTTTDAIPHEATPWSVFKGDFLRRQCDVLNCDELDMNSEDAKRHLKQREINYRKMLMQRKRNEDTIWDDFKNGESEDVKIQETQKHDTNNKTLVKKRKVFENMDTKNLTFEQNDALRKIITKCTTFYYGASLKQSVNDMKYHIKNKEKSRKKEKKNYK